MLRSHHFEIPGVAAPQGSKKFVGLSKKTGSALLVEQSTKVAPWRKHVVAFLRPLAEAGEEPFEGPVEVDITFYFVRPPSARGRLFPHVGGVGDVDKLQRSTFDAFTTARVWGDDAQVVRVHAEKLYAPFGAPAHAVVDLRELL